MSVSKQVLEGSSLSTNQTLPPCGNPKVILRGSFHGKPAAFGLDESVLSKHLLFLGGTGSGKTNLFYQFVSQIQRGMTKDDVCIIFDSKGDFYSNFHQPDQYVIGNSRQYRQNSLKWNIFKEILADGWNETDYMLLSDEICRSLFEERVRNTSNAFFPNAARDLLSSLLICLIREAKKDKAFLQNLYNNELRELIDGCDAEMLRGILNTYPDMRGISSYIEGRGSQSQGVIAELFSVIREVFVGVFAQKGGFSMRNFVRSKGRKVLYIEYDLSIGSVLTPVYRILFDMALKEALGRQNSQGNVYLICDEFKLLPNLQHIEDGVNFGRSLGVKILAGIQSIEQLYESYQEMRGRNIAAGFSSIFAFKANDAGSRDYVSGLLGKNMVLERYTSTGAQYVEEKRIGQVVEDWELGSLGLGEAVVCLPFQPPFRFQFDLYR